VLASHDEPRLATRYGRARTSSIHIADDEGAPWDRELGLRRARAATLLILALPGGAYLYQGEELGLPEIEDIPDHLLQDPMWTRSEHQIRGRDGCRVPLPWGGSEPPYGFTTPGVRTWLPQPADWAPLTVEAQLPDEDSTLNLYRTALRVRGESQGFRTDAFAWLDSPEGVLDFERGDGYRCVVNIAGPDVTLPSGFEVVVSSEPLADGVLPRDTAVWLRQR